MTALHRALDGVGPTPFTFLISRLCEEFGYTPEQAVRAWQRAPEGFLEQVMEARAYARTKAACDAARTRKERPTGPLADLVTAIEFELAQEEMETEAHGGPAAN